MIQWNTLKSFPPVSRFFPNFSSDKISLDDNLVETQKELDFNKILRKTASRFSNIRLIEGSHLLRDFTNLHVDLLHPSDHGMIEMGHNLAKKLKSVIFLK